MGWGEGVVANVCVCVRVYSGRVRVVVGMGPEECVDRCPRGEGGGFAPLYSVVIKKTQQPVGYYCVSTNDMIPRMGIFTLTVTVCPFRSRCAL